MSTPSWDDLKLFLAAARSGRLVAAGRATGLNHTTIARRLTALEGAVGARLFDRSPRGVALTGAGLVLLDHATRMERELDAATALIGGHDAAIAGEVRLSTPEAFGMAIVAPAVRIFRERYPALTLELLPESRAVSLANREADVAITLNPPTRGRLMTRRLIDYRLGLYASRDYLDRRGPIASVEDLPAHDFAGYIDTMLDLPELAYLHEIGAAIDPVFRSTSSAAQQAAVAAGMGLALLHRFAAREDARLVPVLEVPVDIVRSYWLVVHADRQHLPRVRAVIDFIDELVADNRHRFS